MFDDNFDDNFIIILLYGPQIVMYYLYAYDTAESGINTIELN